MKSILLAWLLVAPTQAPAGDVDTDGDGLSDFQERTKYFTDPTKRDSDGDGIPDGDWEERREFAYTVRTILRVLPPVTPDVFCDDYQDARVLERTDKYVELEVIHYPLNTVAEALRESARWREESKSLAEYLKPGLTANWDEPMRAELFAALAKEGIDASTLGDRTLVEKASRWLVRHAKPVDGFSTYCASFPNGRAAVLPGLEETAEKEKAEKGLTIEEQWDRELFARGMFRNGVRGTCTSSAIYLDGCLRALGIPTRIVLMTPLVDGSSARELDMVRKRITHHAVRRTILKGIEPLGHSWSSHTMNEVFVGGRWRRLNYDRLGQNTLDASCFGLMTHVATFSDWADGEIAKTWGLRQAGKLAGDPFEGANPYSAIAVSDRFGVHAKIENPPVEEPREFTQLTIEKIYWWQSPDRKVEMRLDDPETAGHLLVHVREHRPGESAAQYGAFYGAVGKRFVLRAPGKADVPVNAARGYWVDDSIDSREFYLRIEPRDLHLVDAGTTYSLIPQAEKDRACQWKVADGVALTPAPRTPAAPR